MNSPLSSNSWIGRLIGDNQRYRLDKSLGIGCMGEVFLSTDTRVGKEVALKLLKDKWLASGEMHKRFKREIAICAALQSDHIIEISDCGVTDEGFPFYVMEYLRGQTLRYLMLREKQLSPKRTVKIMAQVCKGLQLAHQGVVMQGDGRNSSEVIKVIHRDLKPDNIFLLSKDFGEWVKILDFGIAKIRKESSEQTNLTKTFIGTFRYSSPEQIQNHKDIDGRSDIYSLGIILYEMLTALDPFGLSIKRNKVSESSWLHAHGYQPPIPFKSQPGCEHLSSELEAVVLKCLQKKPLDRFASVEEMREALQAAIEPATSTDNPQHRQIIIEPNSQQNRLGSNEETVFKPQQSTSKSVNPQPQPSQNQSLNQPNHNQQPNIPENQLSQQPLASNQSQGKQPEVIKPQNSASNPPRKTPDGTIYQTPNSSSTQPPKPDGTIYQTPNSSSTQPPKPDGTIYQTPNSSSTQPPKPDGTIYQPQPNSNPSQQKPVDGTIMQSQQNVINRGTPEGTIYQTRADSPPSGQQKPEGTIYQPRTNNTDNRNNYVESQENNLNVLKIISIILGILLLTGVAYYFVSSRNGADDEQSPQTQINQSSS